MIRHVADACSLVRRWGQQFENRRKERLIIIIRDDEGGILLTAWKYIIDACDAEEVEALACKKGLKLAVEWCKQSLIVVLSFVC